MTALEFTHSSLPLEHLKIPQPAYPRAVDAVVRVPQDCQNMGTLGRYQWLKLGWEGEGGDTLSDTRNH